MNFEIGQILGVATYRATGEMVQRLFGSTVESQLTSHDLQKIWLSLALTTVLGLWQVLVALVKWRKLHKFSIGKFFALGAMDIVVFFGIIVVGVGVDQYILKVGEPKEIVAERIGESLLRVKWHTYDKQVGIMVWGYDSVHIDKIALGNAGENKVNDHDVLLEIDPQQEIFYYLVVDGVKHGGDESESEPFKVEVSTGYALEEIEVTNN